MNLYLHVTVICARRILCVYVVLYLFFCIPGGADQPQGKFLCVEGLPAFVFLVFLWRFMAAGLSSSVSCFLSCRGCLPLNQQLCYQELWHRKL